MHTWFECKIKYEKSVDDGRIIKVNETYLVDALSFTEAEARIVEEMKPYISGDFTVANIRRAKINEMFFDKNGDKWYRAKVNFITLDEEKAIEKKTAVTMMVQADCLKVALENLTEGMKGSMADYDVAALIETTVMDVFKFEAN